MITYEKLQTLVSIEHVSLTLGGRQILRDVNAAVQNITRQDCIQGQVVCFLGPSGIGKTQLSRIIAGLQAPTTGRVLLNGVPAARGVVGMVPQTSTLFEFATVQENFSIAAKYDIKKTPAMADYVNRFELKPFLNMYPAQLSGGTRQRVAIVRQLLCSEHLLVMDEPFSGLDLLMKQRACALITQVANLDELNTIIVVTHDVTEGMSIADTVWLMGREAGMPGARIIAQYDLAADNLCWRPDLIHDKMFLEYVAAVKARFLEVAG